MPSWKPDGWADVTPRLFTSDITGLAGFLKAAFRAKGKVEPDKPTVLMIGESRLMISDGAGVRAQMSGFLHLYVDDVDAAHARAIAAGAEIVEPPTDMPYGDRRSTVRDAWGNTWQIATYRGG